MKLGQIGKMKKPSFSAPELNKSKGNMKVIIIIVIAIATIAWIWAIGRKAEETVSVVMLKNGMYKNQQVTEDNLVQYDMLKGEFEKYSIKNSDGTVKQRLIRWEDKDKVVGYFAAYPLMSESILEARALATSRTDNTDSVLYSFPGKEIVQLDVASQDMNAFKTFLQPGDRLNIDAIYSEKTKIQVDDGYGGKTTEDIEQFKSEPVFRGIMIADIINASGESILDLYQSYNSMTTFQQVALENSEDWKTKTEPKSLLVALTPDEKDAYNKFCSKNNVKFKVSLPQRLQ